MFLLTAAILGFIAFRQFQQISEAEIAGAHGVRSAESYGFDLSNSLVPRDELYGTVARRGDTPALSYPATMAGKDAGLSRLQGMYPLVPSDRVIGVVFNGEARAYPVWVLTPHEVCNDTLGGRPIAVTYNPLCDAAAVFDRRVDDQELQFAASGIVYNSNLVMRDSRDSAEQESLWSQLQFRAIAGPAAAARRTLDVLPSTLTSWESWLAAYPLTTIALPDPARKRFYRPNPFHAYFRDNRLFFAVNPQPSERYPLKTPMAIVRDAGVWKPVLADEFDPLKDLGERPVVYAFWFAWSTHHPDQN